MASAAKILALISFLIGLGSLFLVWFVVNGNEVTGLQVYISVPRYNTEYLNGAASVPVFLISLAMSFMPDIASQLGLTLTTQHIIIGYMPSLILTGLLNIIFGIKSKKTAILGGIFTLVAGILFIALFQYELFSIMYSYLVLGVAPLSSAMGPGIYLIICSGIVGLVAGFLPRESH